MAIKKKIPVVVLKVTWPGEGTGWRIPGGMWTSAAVGMNFNRMNEPDRPDTNRRKIAYIIYYKFMLLFFLIILLQKRKR